MKRQHRVDIDIKVVRHAISGAGGSSAVINDWNDKRQRYLTLRQRGASVKWLVSAPADVRWPVTEGAGPALLG